METNLPAGTPLPAQQKLLTHSEVAGLLGVSVRHVKSLQARRLVPFVRLGRLVRFDPAQLREALVALTVSARPL